VNGSDAKADIEGNTVTGLGPVGFIALNGIQAGYGADVKIERNFVSGNSYTGSRTASGGIILVGGSCYFGGDPQTNTKVENNTVVNNDVGVWFSNLAGVYPVCTGPVATLTKNVAQGNKLGHNAMNNPIYQAGISVAGNFDVIPNNDICGPGYPEIATLTLYAIDVDWALNSNVTHNTFCSESSEGWHAYRSKRRSRMMQAVSGPAVSPAQ